MTGKCPHCGAPVAVGITHHGKSSSGSYARAILEVTHPPVAKDATPCPWFAGDATADLVAIAATATTDPEPAVAPVPAPAPEPVASAPAAA